MCGSKPGTQAYQMYHSHKRLYEAVGCTETSQKQKQGLVQTAHIYKVWRVFTMGVWDKH